MRNHEKEEGKRKREREKGGGKQYVVVKPWSS